MSRIDEIFLLARDTLGDHKIQRWTNDTLLRNLNLGIRDIAKQTNLFKMIIQVPLENGRGIYILPDGLLSLSHVTYKSEPLPLRSSGYMDRNYAVDWRTEGVELPDGDLLEAIFDEVKRKELAVYPRPFGDFTVIYVSVPDEYGIFSSLEDYTQSPDVYGVVGALVDTEIALEVQDSYYGVVTAVEEAASLTIYYSRCPPLPSTTADDYELDECFDMALKFYICGTALRNDLDVENRKMASEEFTLYQREVDLINDLATTDSVSASSFESAYNPIG